MRSPETKPPATPVVAADDTGADGNTATDGVIVDGRYRILRELGQGSVAATYEAEVLETGERVALKELSLQGMRDWKVLELFEREAKTLQRLHHPNIPRYIDHVCLEGGDDPRFYTAQQLAPGRDLQQQIHGGWRPSEAQVREIAVQLLDVLGYLHDRRPPIVHRDIKPNNIIRADDGTVYLVDFGAVQSTYCDTVGRGQTIVGTLGYMAPEQARGRADPRSDLFSLGATLAFLLTRVHPSELPQRRLRIDFRAQAKISEPFAQWLDRLLMPAVEDRFDSARQALHAMPSPPKTKRRSRVARNGRVGRRWAPLLVALNVTLVLALGLSLSRPEPKARIVRVPVHVPVPTARVSVQRHSRPVTRATQRAYPPRNNMTVQLSPELQREVDSDFQRMTKGESKAWRLREAHTLLASADPQRARTSYFEAMLLARRSRTKAAIPLLLGALKNGTQSRVRYTGYHRRLAQSIAQTLTLLSGKVIQPNFGDERGAFAAAVMDWWIPNKSQVATDIRRMSPDQRLIVAEALLSALGESQQHASPAGRWATQLSAHYGRPLTAQRSVGSASSYRRIWVPEDLAPQLLPALVQATKQVEHIGPAFPLIAELIRRSGSAVSAGAMQTDTIASSLAVTLARWRAGETLEEKDLLRLLGGTDHLEIRVAIVTALQYCYLSEAATARLVLLLRDRNKQLRIAAMASLSRRLPQAAIAPLMQIVNRTSDREEFEAGVKLLGYYRGNAQVEKRLAQLLRATLRRGDPEGQRRLHSVNRAFINLTKFYSSKASRGLTGSSTERAEAVLAWWDARR